MVRSEKLLTVSTLSFLAYCMASFCESPSSDPSHMMMLRAALELLLPWASLMAQLVKNPPAMRETPVPSLDWEKGKATHSILAWRIPWTV